MDGKWYWWQILKKEKHRSVNFANSKVVICKLVLQDILGALQNHILDFAQRLHSVEIERRKLLLELEKAREEMDNPEKLENNDLEQIENEMVSIDCLLENTIDI